MSCSLLAVILPICRKLGVVHFLTCFFIFLQIIQKPTHDLKQQLAIFSKRVAGSVTELIQAAEAMKGTEIKTCL